MSKVFVPHLPTNYDPARNARIPFFDVEPAKAYGELVMLSDLALRPRRDRHDFDEAMNQIADNVSALGPEDWILAAGDVVLIGVAIAYAADMHGRVRVLRWDRERRDYDPVEIEL